MTASRMPPRRMWLKSKSKSSIGLANINMRIHLHFGKESGLVIQSTKNVGTTVHIKMKLEI